MPLSTSSGVASLDLEAKKRDVVQLLKDYRVWHTAFGGALAPEDSHVKSADYGPAGLIFTGAAFDKKDRHSLREDFKSLNVGLRLLRQEKSLGKSAITGEKITGSQAWASLVEPYIGDPSDPSMVEDWREKARAGYNRKKRVQRRYIWSAMQVERVDLAIDWLASHEPLKSARLHVVLARRMTDKEETEVENENAAIYAVCEQLRVSGLTLRAAKEQTAQDFKVAVQAVERIYEFRHTLKKPICVEEDCDDEPVAHHLCMRHYQQQRRATRKRVS